MVGSSPWVVYDGTARIVLVVVVLAAAAAVAYAGVRLPLPVSPPQPRRTVVITMIAIWVAAIVALLVFVAVYEVQLIQAGSVPVKRSDPITPITLVGILAVFVIIAVVHRARGWRVALGSALIGALAAPWIFEVPFDLIILPRTHPGIDPGLYRVLLFGPLILTGVMTVVLLALSPVVRLRRLTLLSFAATLSVFAAWGLLGFGYPSTPGSIILNTLSKILGLFTGLSLFLPRRTESEPREQAPATATVSS